MRKKKVCICAAQVPFVRGGAELLVQSLDGELRKRGFHVDIANIPFKWYPQQQLLNSCLAWRLMDFSQSNGEDIDLVIGTKFPSYMIEHKNKVVWLIHQYRQIYDQYGTPYSSYTEKDKKIIEQIKALDKKTLSSAKKIYTIANNTTERLKKYNKIEGETLYHPPMHYGKYYHNTYGDYILSVGRLESVKRVDLLIKALKYSNSKTRAVVAGQGPYMEELKRIAGKENVSGQISFLGFVDDKKLLELYANARGVFFAPFDEDYGYITLEAFLSKVPVITTVDSGGVLEFVKNEENGFVTDVSPEMLGKAINKLYDSDKLCEEMGNVGYETVKDINWDIVIDKLTETIR